jgi:hypothetical protein
MRTVSQHRRLAPSSFPSEARVKTRFAALLLLLPIAAACGHQPAAAPSAAAPAAPAATFGGTDLAWIEINIAMNDQLLPLLELVPKHSDDPALTTLCADLQAAATAEQATLHRLHDQAGLPSENPHEGMTMPGLVPAEAVAGAAKLSGPSFTAALISQLKPFLEQSRRLAEDEQKAGTDPQTRALAADTAGTSAAALRRLPA